MAVLLRKTRPPVEAATGREPGTAPHAPYTSQAFRLWEEQGASVEKRRLLELGSAHPESLEHFSAAPCRIEVVGLDCVLPLRVEPNEDESEEQARVREEEALLTQLPRLPEKSQHGALLWDLPNYLSQAQFIALGRWLSRVLMLDAPVHIVLYTGSQMSARPSRFRVLSEDQIVRETPEERLVPCPRLSQGDLKRAWPEFEVVRSFLLRNDSQEFVLRRL